MEVVYSSEMLIPIYQTTRCYNPVDHGMIFHLRKNLKSVTSLSNILPKQGLLFRKRFEFWQVNQEGELK
jgi:hypothetical protein